MRESSVEMLCCPLCKGHLALRIEKENSRDILEGSLTCDACRNRYLIHNAIPRLYVGDDDIIARSGNEEFAEFIIKPENLDRWIRNSSTETPLILAPDRIRTKSLVLLGWILLLSSAITFALASLMSDLTIPLWIVPSVMAVSAFLFSVDYFQYRLGEKLEYSRSLRILKELSEKQALSEYDMRLSTADADSEGDFKDIEVQKQFTSFKGEQIAEVLAHHNFIIDRVLNVGCGGELHKSVSMPYFDRGYEMTGVDVSEEYLGEFHNLFDCDVVQANCMALPFRDSTFNLVNFTDILEHLHHPLLGLSEAQRLLCEDGVIILTTNNHCGVTVRCINPFIALEKAISVYYDEILPPRNMLSSWMGSSFYHTEFSRNRIAALLRAAKLEILSVKTQFGRAEKLTRIAERLPIIRYMGNEFMIVCRKAPEERRRTSGKDEPHLSGI